MTLNRRTPSQSNKRKGLHNKTVWYKNKSAKRRRLYSFANNLNRQTLSNCSDDIDNTDTLEEESSTMDEDQYDGAEPFALTDVFDDELPASPVPESSMTEEYEYENDNDTMTEVPESLEEVSLPLTEEYYEEDDSSNMNIGKQNHEMIQYIIDSNQLRPLLVEKFTDAGLVNFLTSKIGGSLTTKAATSVLFRTIKCLQWIFYHKRHRQLSANKLLITLTNLIKKDFKLLSDYVTYLEMQLELKSSTIVGILTEIVKTSTWFVLFYQPTNPAFVIQQGELTGILAVIKALRRNYRREMTKNKVSATISNITYDMQLPAASSALEQLQKLQQCIVKSLPRFNFIEQQCANKSPLEVFDKNTYENFLRMLFASMYVFSAQGRVSAIQNLTYQDGETLYSKKEILTSKFKTSAKYGFQPIVLANVAIRLYDFYWLRLRPAFSSVEQRHLKAPLWLNYDATPCLGFGNRVTKFFLYGLGINLTTNRIRSLVETAVNSLHRYVWCMLLDEPSQFLKLKFPCCACRDGIISVKEKEAIHNINGHSSKTAKVEYVMADRQDDVRVSRQLFQRLSEDSISSHRHENDARYYEVPELPNDDHSIPEISSEDYLQLFDDEPTSQSTNNNNGRPRFEHPQWGTAHEDYAKENPTKVTWTKQEKDYIGQWVEQALKDKPVLSNLMSNCLSAIKADPSAIPIFHSFHIVNSARLRSGYQAYLKDNRKRPRQNLK